MNTANLRKNPKAKDTWTLTIFDKSNPKPPLHEYTVTKASNGKLVCRDFEGEEFAKPNDIKKFALTFYKKNAPISKKPKASTADDVPTATPAELKKMQKACIKRIEDGFKKFIKEYPESKVIMPKIVFTRRLKTTAGVATGFKAQNKQWTIKLNTNVLIYNGDDFINTTPVHELAHVLLESVSKIRYSHDATWKNLLLWLGGNGQTRHNMDVGARVATPSQLKSRLKKEGLDPKLLMVPFVLQGTEYTLIDIKPRARKYWAVLQGKGKAQKTVASTPSLKLVSGSSSNSHSRADQPRSASFLAAEVIRSHTGVDQNLLKRIFEKKGLVWSRFSGVFEISKTLYTVIDLVETPTDNWCVILPYDGTGALFIGDATLKLAKTPSTADINKGNPGSKTRPVKAIGEYMKLKANRNIAASKNTPSKFKLTPSELTEITARCKKEGLNAQAAMKGGILNSSYYRLVGVKPRARKNWAVIMVGEKGNNKRFVCDTETVRMLTMPIYPDIRSGAEITDADDANQLLSKHFKDFVHGSIVKHIASSSVLEVTGVMKDGARIVVTNESGYNRVIDYKVFLKDFAKIV